MAMQSTTERNQIFDWDGIIATWERENNRGFDDYFHDLFSQRNKMIDSSTLLKKAISEAESEYISAVAVLDRLELKHWQRRTCDRLFKRWEQLSKRALFIRTAKEGISRESVIKARAYPITDLIKNRQAMALCPFHADKTPSMNIKNNFFYCHGCHEHGDVIDFVMKTEHLSFEQAIKRLAL